MKPNGRLTGWIKGLLACVACCALAGCSTDAPVEQVANWSPDPSNYDYHLVLDTTWEREVATAFEGGAPFAVPNDDAGITFVEVEDGIARFRANLTCEGGDIWEQYFALGNVPDVGFVDVGQPFDGATSAEQEIWGQPYFPASTMVVYRRIDYDDVGSEGVSLDMLARVPDAALESDAVQQATAAAQQLEQATLTVDGTFAGGGMTSASYRITMADGFEEAVRAQLDGAETDEPLFVLQRLDYDDIPETAFPNCWMALMEEGLEVPQEPRVL